MAIAITVQLVEATYNMLKLTAPFRGWQLPDSDDVEFSITHSTSCAGHCEPRHIAISAKSQETLDSLIRTVAHEMVHLHEFEIGVREDVKHGKDFKRFARMVCRYHKWDQKRFF